jgi:hypothetical protein
VRLEFSGEPPSRLRARIDYAFRAYCALFGFEPTDADSAATVVYGGEPRRDGRLWAAARYAERLDPARPPAPIWTEIEIPLAGGGRRRHRVPAFLGGEARVDWLGEIFLWLSGTLESGAVAADGAGRLPHAETPAGRYGLDPEVPYATLAMLALNEDLRRQAGGGAWPERPQPPWPGSRHAVVATHDLDFLPLSRGDAARRFGKNLAIALVHHRDPRLLGTLLGTGLRAAAGRRRLFPPVVDLARRERAADRSSTFTVLCRRAHRRDGNYELEEPAVLALLSELRGLGMEIAVHGSYRSLEREGGLADEYARLRSAGFPPLGGRQHWLRYRDGSLFEELGRAGARYDCSVGFPDRIGFRAGASFAYVPYDLRRERPFGLLEFPLAVMDVALYAGGRGGWVERSRRLLDRSRELAWGGISVLWHDTVVAGSQLPRELGDAYWQLPAPGDLWGAAEQVLEPVWRRYHRAGLLGGANP